MGASSTPTSPIWEAPVPDMRPLVATADPALLDDLNRLAAAAGVEPDRADAVATARRGWSTAPLVLVGCDLAPALAASSLERRDGVVLVSRDLDDAQVWALGVQLGVEAVVFLPDAQAWLVDRLADAANIADGASASATTVAVLGGRGGAGATTVACAMAVTAVRRGLRTLLVDGDPLGGGIDLAMGGEDTDGLRWPDLASTRGRVNGSALRDVLPRVHDLTILSWDRGDTVSIPVDAMRSVLAGARRSSDIVVVDLPRRLDDAAAEALSLAHPALLVIPAEIRATASAARVAAAASLVTSDLRLVVRGPAPCGLEAEQVAESLGLPLEGELRAEPGLAAALERGQPPAWRGRGPLAAFCADFLDRRMPRRSIAAT
jgi:secretion/DNA translocation related CpaE-like protein